MNVRATQVLSLTYGSSVVFRGKLYVIKQESEDLERVVLFDPDTGKYLDAPISELAVPNEVGRAISVDLEDYDPLVIAEAQRKYEVIKPLLENPIRSTEDVRNRALETGHHYVTLYKWIALFETTGRISAFVRKRRSDKGKMLIPEEIEQIIDDAIKTTYLTQQKSRVSKVIEKVRRACAKLKVEPPHPNTVRNRIKQVNAYAKLKAREGGKAARDAFVQIQGEFPGADFPLSVVQVDHTPADTMLVDEEKRHSIGRPYITLLIDVFSRMVLGFYISLDPPGNLSLGLCLSQAFLPKEKWLSKFKTQTPWPCWGIPRTIHADNAKEFRGNMLKLACKEYGADLEWRPVATPRYGGHIERLLGTLNHKIQDSIPGTTFSSIEDRGAYDSEAHACMTLSEFEEWFTVMCIDVYHNEPHSALGMSPLQKWKEGILGSTEKPGVGLPPRISDELKLKLDLMPFETRTVQHTGIVWDLIHYQHDVLRRWIDAPDPEYPKHKRKFLCRRDPRDLSVIWFYDPEVKEYYAIPYRNTSRPAISLWELRSAREFAKKQHSARPVDESAIFSALDRLDEIQANSAKLTKKARRNEQRKKDGVRRSKEHIPKQEMAPIAAQVPEATSMPIVRGPIKTFEVDGL